MWTQVNRGFDAEIRPLDEPQFLETLHAEGREGVSHQGGIDFIANDEQAQHYREWMRAGLRELAHDDPPRWRHLLAVERLKSIGAKKRLDVVVVKACRFKFRCESVKEYDVAARRSVGDCGKFWGCGRN
ncbi:hypothetical protein GCM10027027_17200 [Neomicrococcus lactis]